MHTPDNPFDIFDHVYCIHLPNDERRERIEHQFERIGVSDRVQYIYADRPPTKFHMSNMRRGAGGELGVNLSQIKAIVTAISDNAQLPIFFEDDIEFRKDSIEQLTIALSELPDNWDMLYMGGHPRGPVPKWQASRYSSALAKIGHMSFADSYAMQRHTLLEFFGFWCDRITQPKAMYDIILGEFAGTVNTFCTYPILCEQYLSVSQVSGKEDNKSTIIARGWANHLGDDALPEHTEVNEKWKNKNVKSRISSKSR